MKALTGLAEQRAARLFMERAEETLTAMDVIDCVFQPIAATHFSGTRTAFQTKADTISG